MDLCIDSRFATGTRLRQKSDADARDAVLLAEVTTLLSMVRLYPQLRVSIPGELTLVATTHDERELGQMPRIHRRDAVSAGWRAPDT